MASLTGSLGTRPDCAPQCVEALGLASFPAGGLLRGSDLGSLAIPSRDALSQCCMSSCRSVLGRYLRHRHLGDLPAVEGGDDQK